jgi:[ribosomal protein S5]-alanine N-acetyltransferase
MTCLLADQFETERLRLRPPLASDAETIFESYATDAEVCRYLIWQPHASLAVTRNFLEECITSRQTGNRLPFIIVDKSSMTVLGMIEARGEGHKVDIGYVLARAHWGKGFMTEAVAELTRCALAQPSIFRVQATCDVNNIASARVLEKCRFVREARLGRYLIHPNVSPEPRDCFLYARVK